MISDRIKYLSYSIAENSDRLAFDELFCFYFPGLVSFANSIVKDQHLAEEVVEDVFLKLWDNRRTLTSVRNFSHYIYTATKYASINAVKSKKRVYYEDMGDVFLLNSDTAETKLISSENLKRITEEINKLPPKCRLIFRLIKEDGLRYDEVAQLLSISVKTVESQMTIAIKRLVEALRGLFPEYHTIVKSKRSK